MKILFLAPIPPPYGGIARWSETVIDYCNNKKEFNLYHINTGNNVEEINQRSTFDRFFGSLQRTFKVRNKIILLNKREHFKVAHLTTSGGFGILRDIILLKTLKRQKIAVSYHLHFGRMSRIKTDNTWEYKLMKYALSLAGTIVTMDLSTYNEIKGDYRIVKFIPNPIQGIGCHLSNKREVIYLGYVVPEKGIAELLEAWNKLNENFFDWHLKIVGSGSANYINKLKQKFHCENVEFTGEYSHDRAIKELTNASVFVLPSYAEGFPYSIGEAMFAGKAIVATEVGAIPFQLDEESGILCQAKDVKSLQRALKVVMEDGVYRKQLGENARRRANQKFAVEIVMPQYFELWRGLGNHDQCKK